MEVFYQKFKDMMVKGVHDGDLNQICAKSEAGLIFLTFAETNSITLDMSLLYFFEARVQEIRSASMNLLEKRETVQEIERLQEILKSWFKARETVKNEFASKVEKSDASFGLKELEAVMDKMKRSGHGFDDDKMIIVLESILLCGTRAENLTVVDDIKKRIKELLVETTIDVPEAGEDYRGLNVSKAAMEKQHLLMFEETVIESVIEALKQLLVVNKDV